MNNSSLRQEQPTFRLCCTYYVHTSNEGTRIFCTSLTYILLLVHHAHHHPSSQATSSSSAYVCNMIKLNNKTILRNSKIKSTIINHSQPPPKHLPYNNPS